ncbi:hypothetical protein ABIF90_007145 [Bradyrhizobium japonicum]
MTYPFLRARHFVLSIATGAALALATVAPSQAAAKIQRLVSPGGIEAWFVQDATVPLIAMEYSFAGGSAQDPKDKSGVANLVGDLLDEGSGDLDSKTFHERLDRRAIELSFSATRDTFRGSLRMLRDNKDEAFDLLRSALTSPHFDTARRRAHPLAGDLGPAPRDHQSVIAGEPQIPRGRLRRSSVQPAEQRHAGQRADHHGRRHEGLCRPRDCEGRAEDRGGRRRRSGHPRQAARPHFW